MTRGKGNPCLKQMLAKTFNPGSLRNQGVVFFGFCSLILSLSLLLTLLSVSPRYTHSAEVTVSWDPVDDSSLLGYKIYYGTASRNYTTSIDVKNVTSYPVTGLADSTTYYFAVTAYSNTAESGLSNEIVYDTAQTVCTFSLSSKGASFGPSGGAGSVSVTAPGGCGWSSSSPPRWISVTSEPTGKGSGTVLYSVAPNDSTTSRTADLTLASQVFTVTQAGMSTTARFAVGTYTLSVRKAGTGMGSVTNSPSGSRFSAGTVVTLIAAPNRWDSTFSGWSGACSGRSRICIITMNSDASITAYFSLRREPHSNDGTVFERGRGIPWQR